MNVKVDGLTLHVEPDYNPPHPRTDCDHLGTMLCWHRNYIFGDQNRYDTPEDFYRSEEAKNIYVSLPVYMLDHSGTFLSTRGFADVDPDRWDWGQIGIIYCTEEAAKKWFGYLPDKEMLKTQLNGEVEMLQRLSQRRVVRILYRRAGRRDRRFLRRVLSGRRFFRCPQRHERIHGAELPPAF